MGESSCACSDVLADHRVEGTGRAAAAEACARSGTSAEAGAAMVEDFLSFGGADVMFQHHERRIAAPDRRRSGKL